MPNAQDDTKKRQQDEELFLHDKVVKADKPMTSTEKLMVWIVYTMMVFNVGFVCGKTCYHTAG